MKSHATDAVASLKKKKRPVKTMPTTTAAATATTTTDTSHASTLHLNMALALLAVILWQLLDRILNQLSVWNQFIVLILFLFVTVCILYAIVHRNSSTSSAGFFSCCHRCYACTFNCDWDTCCTKTPKSGEEPEEVPLQQVTVETTRSQPPSSIAPAKTMRRSSSSNKTLKPVTFLALPDVTPPPPQAPVPVTAAMMMTSDKPPSRKQQQQQQQQPKPTKPKQSRLKAAAVAENAVPAVPVVSAQRVQESDSPEISVVAPVPPSSYRDDDNEHSEPSMISNAAIDEDGVEDSNNGLQNES